jgi:hypothetical protein
MLACEVIQSREVMSDNFGEMLSKKRQSANSVEFGEISNWQVRSSLKRMSI